jgi:hypothetical protein
MHYDFNELLLNIKTFSKFTFQIKNDLNQYYKIMTIKYNLMSN